MLVFDRNQAEGRIAIFTAEKKSESDFRVALMWRLEGDMTKLDQGYGAFIIAVEKLKELFSSDNDNDSLWQYLGRDCTKVTTTTTNVRSSPVVVCF